MQHAHLAPHRWATVAVLAAGTAVLAGCGGGSAGGATQTPTTSPTSRSTTRGSGAFGPAASGEIVQISGRTLQVQNTSEQTAVSYSSRTRFTTDTTTTLAAVRVGACVFATAPSSAPSSSSTSITATSVRISAAVNGSCGVRAAGAVGGRGAAPTGFPSGMVQSSAVASGRLPGGATPSGGLVRRNSAGGAVVAGRVIAVSGSTITVRMTAPPGKPTTGTVHVGAGTTYRTTIATTHAALRVGLCAVVNGSTDSTGAVAATTVALSHKVNGSCTTFVGGGPNG